MDTTIHLFVRVLRLRGLRVSVAEVIDAFAGMGEPGILADRDTLREALRATLVKDLRHNDDFDEVFDAFFLTGPDAGDASDRAAIGAPPPAAGRQIEDFTLADEPGQRPPRGDDEGRDSEVGELLDTDELGEQFNPHPEMNPITVDTGDDDTIVFSEQNVLSLSNSNQLQLDVTRLHDMAMPGKLSKAEGNAIDVDLSTEQEAALLGWLEQSDEDGVDGDEDDAATLRRRMAGVLTSLPEALKQHLEQLLAGEQRAVDETGAKVAKVDSVGRRERDQLEESLRRLAFSLRGGPTPRRRTASRGRIDSSRTMRKNMRYDGVPFRPVTVRRVEDKPRLVVLADVSLSVRATARFTLHLVHGLQDMFRGVRTFAFVSELTEVTRLFDIYSVEHALGLIFGGDVLDVDDNSNYGAVFGQFMADYRSAVNRRTTLLILGDGRGNGNDPNLDAFEEMSRRAKETIWLTQEPRYSWALGACDLPAYAEFCDRVRVVRDLSALEQAAEELAEQVVGR